MLGPSRIAGLSPTGFPFVPMHSIVGYIVVASGLMSFAGCEPAADAVSASSVSALVAGAVEVELRASPLSIKPYRKDLICVDSETLQWATHLLEPPPDVEKVMTTSAVAHLLHLHGPDASFASRTGGAIRSSADLVNLLLDSTKGERIFG